MHVCAFVCSVFNQYFVFVWYHCWKSIGHWVKCNPKAGKCRKCFRRAGMYCWLSPLLSLWDEELEHSRYKEEKVYRVHMSIKKMSFNHQVIFYFFIFCILPLKWVPPNHLVVSLMSESEFSFSSEILYFIEGNSEPPWNFSSEFCFSSQVLPWFCWNLKVTRNLTELF